MYTSCLYCTASFESNDVIEHQPLGRRLAFDPAAGRLWVICTACARWNLVPFEFRLEAIDECERHFRLARARYSTDHIGLARINEQLELVRIGPALRPEFAAWRYGRVLRRLRRPVTAAAIPATGGVAERVEHFAQRVLRVLTLPIWDSSVAPAMALAEHRLLRDPWTGQFVLVPVAAMAHSNLVIDRDLSWHLEIPYRTDMDGLLGTDPLQLLSIRDHHSTGIFRGESILPTLGRTLPVFERRRPGADQVHEAIRLLELAGGEPSRLFSYVLRKPIHLTTQRTYPLLEIAPEVRLALEMSAHEETERRALEGELKLLEREWREAERVAKIADDLA
ncbi:MAG TPA: hypothetical protein PLL69_11605 [Gemmatimonadales bacterium]|nr:hypothetical protein [Gemmatimonadales bacterium]